MKYPIIIVASLVVLIGGYFVLNNKTTESAITDNDQAVTLPKDETKKDNPPADTQPVKELTKVINFQGEKIAHNYYIYDPADYAAALNANRPIFLFFYANWCPTCAEQEPMIVSLMNSFENNPDLKDFVAFRINYNDNETNDSEKDLSIEFGVLYQHTMFTLDKNGSITEKFIGQTREDILRTAISEAVI